MGTRLWQNMLSALFSCAFCLLRYSEIAQSKELVDCLSLQVSFCSLDAEVLFLFVCGVSATMCIGSGIEHMISHWGLEDVSLINSNAPVFSSERCGIDRL